MEESQDAGWMSGVEAIFESEGAIMTMTIETAAHRPPALTRDAAVRLASAGPSLWRVLDRAGRVLGHLQAVPDGSGMRFRARRFHAASRAFRDLGDFWSPDDAVDCLRFAR